MDAERAGCGAPVEWGWNSKRPALEHMLAVNVLEWTFRFSATDITVQFMAGAGVRGIRQD